MTQRTILFVTLRYAEFYSHDLLEEYKRQHDVRIVACVDRGALGRVPEPILRSIDAVHLLPSVKRLDFWPVFAQEDVEAVLQAERNAFPHREISILCCDELNLIMVGAVRRKYAIPGPDDAELRRFRDKLLMKQILQDSGIRVPRFIAFDSQAFLAGKESHGSIADKVGRRFVVKPVDAAASAGVEVIDSQQQLLAYCGRIDPSCRLEIEEFIDGTLFHVDSLTQDGKSIFHVVSEYSCPNAEFAKGRVLASINLPPTDALRERLVQFATRVLHVLKPTHLCSHMELFVSGGEIVFLEVAGRPPGAAVCRAHLLGCGVNFMDMDFKIQTGQSIQPLADAGGHAFWAYVPKRPGRVRHLNPPALKSDFDIEWRVREAEEVTPSSTVLDVAAVVLASNPNYEALRRDFDHVRDSWTPFELHQADDATDLCQRRAPRETRPESQPAGTPLPVHCAAGRAARPAVLDLIGNTPMVEITQFDTGCCQLFLKLESQNPGGSIKDRIGLAMIETAERDGRLKPGGTVIEATAGNTGLGLALVARAKGYRVVLVVPDKMSLEKVLHLKALGAEVHTTRSDVGKGHPDYYQDMAARLARDAGDGAVYIDQFNNPANPLAHEMTTAPEIWQQMGHRVDTIVCGVGSGGTITGLKRYFERVSPRTEFVLADPKGSVLCDYIATGHCGAAGSWDVEGIGEDFIPAIADLTNVRSAYAIGDEESFRTARDLLKREGILAGSSTGTLLAAALRHCRAQTTPKRVMTFVCDTGTRYLSKVYNDSWMFDQGLLQRSSLGDLRDLISRRVVDEAVISVSPDDTMLTAFQRMRAADISQVPVLQDGKLVGLLDESDLLLHVRDDAGRFRRPVSQAMNRQLRTLRPDAGLEALFATLADGWVAVVADANNFYGLITRFDLLNYLRKTLV